MRYLLLIKCSILSFRKDLIRTKYFKIKTDINCSVKNSWNFISVRIYLNINIILKSKFQNFYRDSLIIFFFSAVCMILEHILCKYVCYNYSRKIQPFFCVFSFRISNIELRNIIKSRRLHLSFYLTKFLWKDKISFSLNY